MAYRIDGFSFNRDSLAGLDPMERAGVSRFLSARERAINTIDTETLVCSGGPFDGKTIDMTAESCNTATFSIGKFTGHYEKYTQNDSHSVYACAAWHGTDEKTVQTTYATPQAKNVKAEKSLGNGFSLLSEFLASMADEAARQIVMVDVVSYKFVALQKVIDKTTPTEMALFYIGRATYRVLNTPESIEALRAKIIKAKKWFSDAMLKKSGVRRVDVVAVNQEPVMTVAPASVTLAAVLATAQAMAKMVSTPTQVQTRELVTCVAGDYAQADNNASTGYASSTTDGTVSYTSPVAEFLGQPTPRVVEFLGDDADIAPTQHDAIFEHGRLASRMSSRREFLDKTARNYTAQELVIYFSGYDKNEKEAHDTHLVSAGYLANKAASLVTPNNTASARMKALQALAQAADAPDGTPPSGGLQEPTAAPVASPTPTTPVAASTPPVAIIGEVNGVVQIGHKVIKGHAVRWWSDGLVRIGRELFDMLAVDSESITWSAKTPQEFEQLCALIERPQVAGVEPIPPVAISTGPRHPHNIIPVVGLHILEDAFEAWTYSKGGRFGFVMYLGKSAKPWAYYGYATEAKRDDGFKRHADEARAIALSKANRKAETKTRTEKPHGLQVGDVVRSSWGYDQTNVNHYQIVNVIGKRTVEVRKLVEHNQDTGDMTGRVAPVWGDFAGEVKRCIVDQFGGVNVLAAKYGRAHKIEPLATVHGVRCYAATGYSSYA